MKKYILPMLLLACNHAIAQDVDVDKTTGLVKVDDKETFYLTPKNKSMMESDFSLENLQHEELAYLKLTKCNTGSGNSINYQMVFTQTGDQCMLSGFGTFSIIKPLAKKIAGAGLVKNGKISDVEERKFILMNNGTFLKSPASAPTEKVVVVDNTPKNNGPADISLKGTSIYNTSELVGIFKTSEDGDISTLSVYNNNDALVCKATHPRNNEEADWNLQLDGKTVTLLYNKNAPVEKLMKYLVEKGYL
ncbi:MAG: hypothetical protein EOP47_07980 [Sphingobacteriaceae bacterium]|nr:MAG: hypothetical protein EOP47_07980 [Sphingobacteriaceae bacterium]